MMKKRILILTLLFLMTTGCSVNYEITINENTISELVQITENVEYTSDNVLYIGQLSYSDAINNLYNNLQPVYTDSDVNPYDENQVLEGVDYYNKNIISSENQYGLEINYNHAIAKYVKSNTINTCYKNVSVLEEGNNITLSTGRNNYCFEKYKNLEEINVYVKFDTEKYAVISHNADEFKDGEYYWNINTKNYNDKSIVIQLEKKKEQKKYENAMLILIGTILIIVVVGLLIFFIGKNQNKRKNKI